jgi:hypothetical protein
MRTNVKHYSTSGISGLEHLNRGNVTFYIYDCVPECVNTVSHNFSTSLAAENLIIKQIITTVKNV